MMPRPHGGRLVNRVLRADRRVARVEEARSLPAIPLDVEAIKDVKGVAGGTYSPLTGFLGREDYDRVLDDGRLASDVPWTIPLVLAAPPGRPVPGEGDLVALVGSNGEPVATLLVEEVHPFDRERHARAVFGTTDAAHPGVARLPPSGARLLGGPIELLDGSRTTFPEVNLAPAETRVLFRERGWRTIAGYQTRNPPHRAHEHLHKIVLSLVDGLFVNPVVGRKKPGDFRDEVVLDAYRALLAAYYPRDRVALGVLPYEMKYAGPREAIHHAIVRKNFGCSHFVVGRDHAGVGSFYRPDEAIEAFDAYPDLGIAPIAVRGAHRWCRACGSLESERTCPHSASATVPVSGTLLRDILRNGGEASPEIVRPEVLAAIAKHDRPFVDGG